MKLNYKAELGKLSSDILDMTKNGLILWEKKYPYKNELIFEYVGDNKSIFQLKYKWEFSNDEWKLNMPHLEITGVLNNKIQLYEFRYPKVKELGKYILDNFAPDFSPDGESIHEMITSSITGYCIRGERDKKISDIENQSSI